jgi:hypothetical protein
LSGVFCAFFVRRFNDRASSLLDPLLSRLSHSPTLNAVLDSRTLGCKLRMTANLASTACCTGCAHLRHFGDSQPILATECAKTRERTEVRWPIDVRLLLDSVVEQASPELHWFHVTVSLTSLAVRTQYPGKHASCLVA